MSAQEPETADTSDLPLGPVAMGEDDVVQVVLLKPTFDWIQAELRGRGLYLFPIPVGGDDPPTYGVGVGRRLMSLPSVLERDPDGGDR